MSEYQSQEYSSAQPQPRQTPGTSPSATPRPLSQAEDDINTPFATLDANLISAPYNADQASHPALERSVADALMRLAMNVRAWSEARPAHEANREKTHLISEIRQIESREQEQGTSSFSILESVRQRLVGFVASVKSALDDLQG